MTTAGVCVCVCVGAFVCGCAYADRLGLLPDVVVRTVGSPARANVNSATVQ